MSVTETFGISAYIDVKVRRWNEQKQKYGKWLWVEKHKPNLKPTIGLTFFLKQCYGSVASGTAMGNTATGCNFMAVGTSSTAPASGDTTLGTEATTNGLGRVQAVTVVAQPTATVTNTFTDVTALTNSVQEGGLFDAVSAGNLGHHFTFTSTNLAVNDQLQITVTITIS